MKTMSKYFINGLIVIVPIAITFFVIMQIFAVTEGLMGKHLPIHFPGIGLIAVLLIIFLVGWLSSHWMLKKLLSYAERLVNSIPIIKFIYNSVKQLSTAVFESQHLFKQAVLIPYPHPGVKTLGFIMSDLSSALSSHLDEEHVCVFVPMSLNMTAGFNIIIPKKDIIHLNVTSESALQYVLTAGSIMPQTNDNHKI